MSDCTSHSTSLTAAHASAQTFNSWHPNTSERSLSWLFAHAYILHTAPKNKQKALLTPQNQTHLTSIRIPKINSKAPPVTLPLHTINQGSPVDRTRPVKPPESSGATVAALEDAGRLQLHAGWFPYWQLWRWWCGPDYRDFFLIHRPLIDTTRAKV